MSFDASCCVTCPCLKCSTDRVPYSPALLYSCMSIRLVGRVERVIWLATLGLWVKDEAIFWTERFPSTEGYYESPSSLFP